jgi:hypothetical protein
MEAGTKGSRPKARFPLVHVVLNRLKRFRKEIVVMAITVTRRKVRLGRNAR